MPVPPPDVRAPRRLPRRPALPGSARAPSATCFANARRLRTWRLPRRALAPAPRPIVPRRARASQGEPQPLNGSSSPPRFPGTRSPLEPRPLRRQGLLHATRPGRRRWRSKRTRPALSEVSQNCAPLSVKRTRGLQLSIHCLQLGKSAHHLRLDLPIGQTIGDQALALGNPTTAGVALSSARLARIRPLLAMTRSFFASRACSPAFTAASAAAP